MWALKKHSDIVGADDQISYIAEYSPFSMQSGKFSSNYEWHVALTVGYGFNEATYAASASLSSAVNLATTGCI
jgi:hypothetical protein